MHRTSERITAERRSGIYKWSRLRITSRYPQPNATLRCGVVAQWVGQSSSSSSVFSIFGVADRVFNLHVLRSCASSIFTLFSFMPFLM